jgi:2-methylcitrate dehydratase PrpD
VAGALLGGSGLSLGLDDFRDQLVRDPERVALMARVEVEADQRCDAIFPEHAPAIVDAVTTDGTRWHEEVLTNRGSPQRPLTPEEVAAKFAMNAGRTLPDPQAGFEHRALGEPEPRHRLPDRVHQAQVGVVGVEGVTRGRAQLLGAQ